MQITWSVANAAQDVVPAVRALRDPGTHHSLVVLPLASLRGSVPTESSTMATLGAVARALGVHLAGSAQVRTGSGAQTVGFVIDPSGTLILRMAKITPDFMTGFSDGAASTGAPCNFASADTPFGRLGLLVGEDLLYATHLRAMFFAGAELIINPAVEVTNDALETRRELPKALCAQNALYIASATPARRPIDGGEERLPTRTALTDWQGMVVSATGEESGVSTRIDVEGLRTFRALNPARAGAARGGATMVRDALYAPLFRDLARHRPPFAMPKTKVGWREEADRRMSAQEKPLREDRQDVYRVVCAQTQVRMSVMFPASGVPLSTAERRAEIGRIVRENLASIAPVAADPEVRLVVFPEFAMSGAGYRKVADIRSVALQLDGPELTQVSAFAQKYKTYVVFEQMEDDPQFPGYVFNTAYLVGDNGDLVIKHRKLQDADQLGSLVTTTPGSVFDRYVQTFGFQHLVDVADTPIGRIGLTICYENMWPEVAAILAQKGAEIITHSTSESFDGTPDYAYDTARRQMALTGTNYLISADTGQVDDGKLNPYFRSAGRSEIIDFNGRFLRKMQFDAPGMLTGTIDLGALRAARRDPRRNLAIWDDPRVYLADYSRNLGIPNNLWTDPDVFPYAGQKVLMDVQKRYIDQGVYVPPARPMPSGK